MIPKIIHTCWFTKDNSKDLPEKMKSCIESWKRYCPDFEIKVWRISDWDFMNYPYAKQCWEAGSFSQEYLIDFFKYWVLYNNGGFFFEIDQALLSNLKSLLNEKAIFGIVDSNSQIGTLIGCERYHSIPKHFIANVYSKRTWINSDNSLNIPDLNFAQNILMSIGYDLNLIRNEQEKICLQDLTVFSKEYFFSENPINGVYSTKPEKMKKYISIVMPIWNSERYLREAIDSVLSQDFKDFELLCIDDGSTDSSSEIIKSYKDDRVVYIKKNHSGIVDSLNIGFSRAIGKYIVRFDSDDIMLPGRLSHQFDYMEKHPDLDILGSGFQWGNGKSIPEFWRCPEKKIKISEFKEGNLLCHPATIFRTEKIKELPYIYENYYQGCEDFKLWHHALHHGLVIGIEPTPVIIYRQHPNQATNSKDYFEKSDVLVKRTRRIYEKIEENNPELTCIIPFQNEGFEVERTVSNIRATVGNRVKILLINDRSDDNQNSYYRWIARSYGCDYIENEKNLGVAASRNLGVSQCETEYFVLLDSHMRFYEDNWHEGLLKNLKENPGCLISSNSIIISYDNTTKLYKNEDGIEGRTKFGSYGAFINVDEEGWEFTAKWTGKIIPGYENENLIPISCCMGAVYAMSKKDWDILGGLKGLIKYGSDESLISLKVWLSGNKVLLMKNWGVGHLYRGSSPYAIPLKHLDQNQIYLINLFAENDKDIEKFELNLRHRIGFKRFNAAKEVFEENREDFTKFKEYFYKNVAKKSLSWFLENINKHVS